MAEGTMRIKISEDGVIYHNLPYAFRADMPYFEWVLPTGVNQAKYCLELKTRYPRMLTGGAYGHGYYNSGLVVSGDPRHKVLYNLDSNTWRGCIEIRLRVLNPQNKVVYSTHIYNQDAHYDFEPSPQGYMWDIKNDFYYCVRDVDYPAFNKESELSVEWNNSWDDDDLLFERDMAYQVQVSGSPLFDEGTFLFNNYDQHETGAVTSFINYSVADFNEMMFYRVRAHDGYDYSDWSVVRAFMPFFNNVPVCRIIDVNTNIYPRSEGEISIDLIVNDDDNTYANVFLEYSLGYVIPESNAESLERCALLSTGAAVPTNTVVNVTWLSARTIVDKTLSGVYVYLHAYDGLDKSAYDSYGPIDINNAGIGFGVGGGSIDNLDYRVAGKSIDVAKYLMVPEERVVFVDGEMEVDTDDKLGTNESFAAASHLTNILRNKVKRNIYAMYHGYDFLNDNRLMDELSLDYKGEAKHRILRSLGYTDRQIQYNQYPSSLNSLFSGFSQIYLQQDKDDHSYYPPDDEEDGVKMGLGRENDEVFYHLSRRPDVEPYIKLHRPHISGGYGIYVDGPGINASTDDYGNYAIGKTKEELQDDNGEGGNLRPAGELWGNMYGVSRIHDPTAAVSKFYVKANNVGNQITTPKNSPYGSRLWTVFYVKMEFRFPLTITAKGDNQNDRFCFILNNDTEITGSILDGVDFQQFHFPYTAGQYSYDQGRMNDLLAMLNRMFFDTGFFDKVNASNFSVDMDNRSVVGYAYGRKSHRIKSLEVVKTSRSCYDALGIETIFLSQTYDDLNDNYSWYAPELATFEDVVKELEFDHEDNEYQYQLQAEAGYAYGGMDDAPTLAEPLFTCSPDDVNADGFHFRYSRERYEQTGKVYVRTYRTESCFPFKDKILEYRDFVVVPTDREGVYRRRRIKAKGGNPAMTQIVEIAGGIRETAYFDPEKGALLSHTLDSETGFYTRLPAKTWLPKICHKTLYVAEYLPCELAVVQNHIDRGIEGNLGYFRRSMSVNPAGGINSGYNLYLMGAYQPSREQQDQGLAVPSYDYSSIVSSGQTGDISRFNKYWLQYTQDAKSGGCDFVFVDPNLIGLFNKVVVQHAYGYQPDTSNEAYFKLMDAENSYDRHAVVNSYYVHSVLRDQHLSPRFMGKIIKDYGMISDTSFMLVNEDFTKVPLWDIRLRGRYNVEGRNYFSGLPRDEHPAFADRPDIVYREDRPWRINGFVRRLEELKTWGFRFLQNEWNTYNKIHWYGAQSKYNYAKIEAAQRDDDGNYADWFNVRTESAVFFSDYGWLVPYNRLVVESDKYDVDMFNQQVFPKDWVERQIIPTDWFGKAVYQSDYIDTLNSDDFHFGKTYRFRISSVNIIDGSTNQPTSSTSFILDMDAASPPVIVAMSVDKWTRILRIKFRFDDIQGRQYDLSDFDYSIDNGATWVNEGFQHLEGNLRNLASNKSGSRVAMQQSLITHEVRIDLNLIAGVFERPAGADDMHESSLLVRLSAVLSEDKEGLTYPVFEFRMWLNELLKSSEDQIYRLAGGKTRWKYSDALDVDGVAVGSWEYLPLGEEITIPGEIKTLDNQIAKFEDGFSKWYSSVKKHHYPSVDARLDYMTFKGYAAKYKLFCFNKYLVFKNIDADYQDYVAGMSVNDTIKMNTYLQTRLLVYDFEDYCYRRNVGLSCLFLDYMFAWPAFTAWYGGKQVEPREDVYPIYIDHHSLGDDYALYKTENGITEEDYEGFLIDRKLMDEFESFYNTVNKYTNEKSVERISYVGNHAEMYDNWLLNPVDLDGNSIVFNYLPVGFDEAAYDDDKAVWFLEWAYKGNLMPNDDFVNNFVDSRYLLGRQAYFMRDNGGISLSQQYSAISNERVTLLRRLNEAYSERNFYETRHRARLIREGCFCNGFPDNKPYSSGTTINTAFRFRVENKPIEGNLTKLNQGASSPSYVAGDDVTDISAGYEKRFDVYFHFQLDFFNSFDSQGGFPIRDVVYQPVSNSNQPAAMERIPAGIVAEEGVKSAPNHVYSIRDEYNGYDIVAAINPSDKRHVGNYSMPKNELPGKLMTDTVPPIYNDYNQLYFWRVAPYNVIERPVVEISFGEADPGSIEYVGVDGYYGDKMYKFNYLNRFPAKILETHIGGGVGGAYGQMQNKVQVATSEKDAPVWQLDDGGGTYNYYTWGTHINKGDMWYKSELVNKDMIGRGEVQFLTDRARMVEKSDDGDITDGTDNYSISHIEDRSNNFHALWVPFNTRRGKPCVVRDSDKCEYYMFYHKLNSTKHVGGNAVDSNVIVFSIGFNPFVFGEVQRCFPLTANIDIESVVRDAISFENPWVIKDNGVYHMFFNVVTWNSGAGAFEINAYLCQSADLTSWSAPAPLESLHGCTDIMVHKENGVYKLYCIKQRDFNIGGSVVSYRCVFSATSDDLSGFGAPEFVYGGDYQLSSPCFSNGRLYYSANNQGHIVSIGRTRDNNGNGNDEFDADYPEPNANNPVFAIPPDDKLRYCNPCVIEDYDLGNKIERMYFNFNQNPYLWGNGALKKFGDKNGTWFYHERTIGTMYLEKYNWEDADIEDIKMGGSSIPFRNDGYSGNQIPCSVDGVELEIHFRHSSGHDGGFHAVRVPANAWSSTIESESRAEWISRDNLGMTEATLIPEAVPDDYDADDYKPIDYLNDKGLFDKYLDWRSGYQGEPFPTESEYIEAYLVLGRKYGDYVKWAVRGAGIYRQTPALMKLGWIGDGEDNKT